MKSWLYIKEESIYYFQLLRNWLVGDREAELENFESTRFHLYVELFYFCFIFSDYVINVLCHLVAPWNCYVIIKPILCLEADDDWLRSSDWLNLVFRSIFLEILILMNTFPVPSIPANEPKNPQCPYKNRVAVD